MHTAMHAYFKFIVNELKLNAFTAKDIIWLSFSRNHPSNCQSTSILHFSNQCAESKMIIPPWEWLATRIIMF